jgi:signal transduction histidine kinase
LRIFLEIAERKKIAMTQELAATNQRAEVMRRTSVNLKQLLDEREEIIRQLALFNKTAGMGALVASLAHELNQPLTAIQLNAELIDSAMGQGDASNNATVQLAMRDLMSDNQRAATIIKTLRNMFGSGRKSISEFDLNDLVNEVLLLCKAKIETQRIQLVLELHANAVPITGDKSQLQQVLLNLITNAIDAFESKDTPHKYITVCTRISNRQAILTVTDNGSGIAPDVASTLFELLRTTKKEGMGIGLWLSRTIVESHQGTIEFETSAATGTTFKVVLPATTEALIY